MVGVNAGVSVGNVCGVEAAVEMDVGGIVGEGWVAVFVAGWHPTSTNALSMIDRQNVMQLS